MDLHGRICLEGLHALINKVVIPVPPLLSRYSALKRRGETGITASEIGQAEEFNGKFMDAFNKSDHIEVPFLSRSAPFMDDIVVSKEDVTKLLKGLNPFKALGPDGLLHRVLKELATELGPVFAHLFQNSLDIDEIPKGWSLANICPLYKKGSRM